MFQSGSNILSGIRPYLLMVCCLFASVCSCGGPREDIVLFDFESGQVADWTLTGDNPCYGGGPVSADTIMAWDRFPAGFVGERFLFSGGPDGGHAPVPDGGLVSPAFEISRDYLAFFLAGGLHPHVRVYLLVDDIIVREAFGNNFHDLLLRGWDVREFKGENARFGIENCSPAPSRICVDHIVLTDTPPLSPALWVELPSRQRSPLMQPGEFKLILDARDVAPGRDICSSTILRGGDGRWHLYASLSPAGAGDRVSAQREILHATADSLFGTWSCDGVVMRADPGRGEPFVAQPFTVYHDGTYYMYYVGSGEPWGGWYDSPGGTAMPWGNGKCGEQGPYCIHLAMSADGRRWERKGPVVTDAPFAFTPHVVHVGDEWILYYAAAEPSDLLGKHAIVARTSYDLIHWSERRVAVLTDYATGASPWPEKSFVQDPIVFKHGDAWFLLAGPVNAQNLSGDLSRWVYASGSPLAWDINEHYGAVLAEHGDVLRGDNGEWVITHANTMSGGVWIAPLYWEEKMDE